MENEVILKLKPRPLRLAYLANTVKDLNNAVTLYTHLWGGISNAIFPVPKSVNQNIQLQYALRSINPDYILLPEEELPSDITEILSQLPSRCLQLSSNRIDAIANITDHLSCFQVQTLNAFNLRDFPHIIRSLQTIYREPKHNSNFFLISHDSLFDLESSLQFGIVSSRYQDYLRNHLSARLISIKSIDMLLKVSLMATIGFLKSPISLTKTEFTNTESSWGWDVQDHEEVYNLFLCELSNVNILAGFWNSRRLDVAYSNKLILPKNSFIENLEENVTLLLSFFPSMRELRIYVNLSNSDAVAFANDVYAISSRLSQSIFIRVYYQDIGFNFNPGRVYYSKPIITTREISSSEGCIRFSSIVPSGYENSNCAFGYDAEINSSLGKSLSIPFTQDSAVLLSNGIEQVTSSESSTVSLLRDWQSLKTQPVRPADKGVTGIAISNEECRIYFPESKEIITRSLKNSGFLLEPNDHTRYAQGFIKRFGGFNKTRKLVKSRGVEIFVALSSTRALQCGFKHSEIVGFLAKNFNLSRNDAKKIVDQNLPGLLEAGLIYRGYPLKCPNCGLQDWYKIDKVNEFVECTGCAEHFQLQSLSSLEFAYKPNELAARFLNSDGPAILSTMVVLTYLDYSGHSQIGGDLKRLGEKHAFADVDLLVLIKDCLILAECKTRRLINEAEAIKIIEHLERVIETAILVGARVVVLGVVTTSLHCDLCSLAAIVAETAADKGVGVHLLINDSFYLWAQRENQVTDLWQLNINSLLVQDVSSIDDSTISVGEPVREYIWGAKNRLINRDLLEIWENEVFSDQIYSE